MPYGSPMQCQLPIRVSIAMLAWLCMAASVASMVGCKTRSKDAAAPRATLIVNARIVDGTGVAPAIGAVRIQGDRIVAIGELQRQASDEVVDAQQRVIAPGFIDTHSHHDVGLFDTPDASAAIAQGITTIVVGQDGMEEYPAAELLERVDRAVALNVATFVGHGAVRSAVMGEDFRRAATAEELDKMRSLVADGMRAGAFGLSSGLEYDPGIYASKDELIALAAEAGRSGGRYFSHMRSEDRELWSALDEIVALGRINRMPVHVSHMKLAMTDWWGQASRFIEVLDRARAAGVEVSGDIYPYDYWNSTMTVLFPERNFKDIEAARFALRSLVLPEQLIVARFSPEPALAGRTLQQIAQSRKVSPEQTLLDLIAQSQAAGAHEQIIATSMQFADIAQLMSWPHANICSDGMLDDTHPRGAGAFTRVLREFVRERGVLSLESAIQKMTSASASHVGLQDRGVIVVGAFADLVLFDPATVTDRSTLQDPRALADGIDSVWVNGVRVRAAGRSTGATPGRALRRQPPQN